MTYAQSVPALISKNVGNTLTNYTTWNDILFNVKKYGAKGDGVTDDTAAIAAALAAAAVTGGEVHFPPGTYIYSTNLTPPSNILVTGVKGASKVKMKPSVLPTFAFFNVGSVSNITVRDLSFEGNSVAPTTPGTAEAACFFLNCTNILFDNCYFTKYMGIGIAFQGGTDTKVTRCKFEDHGQNLIAYRGLSPKAVPAIWAAYSNMGTSVIDCDFVDCRWSAVSLLGKQGKVSHCRLSNIGESGIYLEYSSTSPTDRNIVSFNNIDRCYQIDVTACGIECASNNTLIEGNVISHCDADGIGISTASHMTIKGNICFNNNFSNTLNTSGISLSYKGTIEVPYKGKGIIVEGNRCYDDQTIPTQKYGIKVYTASGSGIFTESSIQNNSFDGNVTGPIYVEPGLFEDSTNHILGNSAWLDVLKSTSASTTSSTSEVNLKTLTVPAYSIGKNGGIRIIAYGTTTGATNDKYISLKFGSASLYFISVVFTGAENGRWRIEATVYNQNATNSQNQNGISLKNATIYAHSNSTATVDTTTDQLVIITGQVLNAADSVICNGLIVERI